MLQVHGRIQRKATKDDAMKLLDHGYLDYVEHWGSDESIVRAARMSTDKGFLGWGPKGFECHHTGCGWKGPERPEGLRCPVCGDGLYSILGDEKLLRYLWENQHTGPFEFCGLTVEVKAPIMVFREWHRHRTQSFNEMSARYVPLPDENFIPDAANIVERARAAQMSKNKQAQGHVAYNLTTPDVIGWLAALADAYRNAERVYQHGLDIGIPKELARLPVPVGRYSRMRATANLLNWLRFLKLRTAPTAQYEIRVYADAVGQLLSEHFPPHMGDFQWPTLKTACAPATSAGTAGSWARARTT
jgi:thymidylate synthase (FAD)